MKNSLNKHDTYCVQYMLTICSRLNNGPKVSRRTLIPKTCEYDLIWQKGFYKCDEIKDLEMGKLP